MPPSYEQLSHLFRFFGETQCRGRSDVYATLSAAVADDDQLLELTSTAPPDQRRPSLLFAAVNLLLANDQDAALRSYYPIHGGTRKIDARLAPTFAAFCREHWSELEQLLATRSTQTNEIRRCFALRLGRHELARHWPGPVHLLEIGASAGLNLIFDRYAYRLDGSPLAGGDESTVVVETAQRGITADRLWADRPAPVRQRLGLDQHPVDLDDPEARNWLEAFIWPERIDDLATLRGAIEAFRTTEADVRLVRGDAVADTAAVIDELPGDEPVLVFTASLLSYLDQDQRTAFDDQLRSAAERRRIGWVFAEGPALLARSGIDAAGLSGPLASVVTNYAVGVSLRSPDTRHDQILALAEPYLRWIAPARVPDDDFAWASDPTAP
ncbi:DUF2332 domain-containing protein [Microlunatus parietis]|uniref:DUF2332 domain-containing protein n=1 Tax=Microlunatus parietis TaxID=682979 RepID=A0A7Y9LDN9_9ACTN|nr:DUF2332 domain-containing protein [Microlunatus parietis]NYE72151.1 hypothetical protein [Microlunatus parietis]